MKKKLIKTSMAIGVMAVLFTGCGNEEIITKYSNGQTNTISHVDGDKKLQDSYKFYNEIGEIQKDLIYKDNQILSGYEIVKQTGSFEGNPITEVVKVTYENAKEISRVRVKDLTSEYERLITEVSPYLIKKIPLEERKKGNIEALALERDLRIGLSLEDLGINGVMFVLKNTVKESSALSKMNIKPLSDEDMQTLLETTNGDSKAVYRLSLLNLTTPSHDKLMEDYMRKTDKFKLVFQMKNPSEELLSFLMDRTKLEELNRSIIYNYGKKYPNIIKK